MFIVVLVYCHSLVSVRETEGISVIQERVREFMTLLKFARTTRIGVLNATKDPISKGKKLLNQ